MAFGQILGSGGGASYDEIEITARAGDVLQGKTTLDANGELISGTIQTYNGSTTITPLTVDQTFATNGKYLTSNITVNSIPSQHQDSGNAILTTNTTSKVYAPGWYNYTHGAEVNLQNKTITAGVTQLAVEPDTNKLLNKVTINPTPSHESTITAGVIQSIVTPTSGKLLSKVYVNPTPSRGKTVTPLATSQVVYPESGEFLSSVSVNPIPNQINGQTIKLTAQPSQTAIMLTANHWLLTDLYVYVDVFTW